MSSCLSEEDSDDDNAPVTSLPCQWRKPKKRKAASMEVSVAEFRTTVFCGSTLQHKNYTRVHNNDDSIV